MSDNIIQINNMNKWFGDFQVLKGINLEVKPKQKIVVCGPSGSGKSTLIRCINRLEEHQEGDIIVEFNDKEVVSQRVLPKLVADAKIGQPANVKIWRNEKLVNLSVTLGIQPTAEVLASIENNISIIPIKELGIRVRSISNDDRAKLKLNNSLNGVIIDDIDSDSFLVRQGISVDDIIIEIQGKQVQNSSDLLGVINDVIAQGKENVLLVFYAGQNAKKYIGAKLSVK